MLLMLNSGINASPINAYLLLLQHLNRDEKLELISYLIDSIKNKPEVRPLVSPQAPTALKGSVLKFDLPFEPAGGDDWEVIQ
jgi:hypothetical protein